MHSALHTRWTAVIGDNPRADEDLEPATSLLRAAGEVKGKAPVGNSWAVLQNVRNRLTRNTHANSCSLNPLSLVSYPLVTAICGDRIPRRRRTATGPRGG